MEVGSKSMHDYREELAHYRTKVSLQRLLFNLYISESDSIHQILRSATNNCRNDLTFFFHIAFLCLENVKKNNHQIK